jgi:hypothetical protein
MNANERKLFLSCFDIDARRLIEAGLANTP